MAQNRPKTLFLSGVYEAKEQIVDACDEKPRKQRKIFGMVITQMAEVWIASLG